ncbi:MAG: hypothetical protein ACOYJG_08735 [Prevotella sp.]|jgi:hypothetical protein
MNIKKKIYMTPNALCILQSVYPAICAGSPSQTLDMDAKEETFLEDEEEIVEWMESPSPWESNGVWDDEL